MSDERRHRSRAERDPGGQWPEAQDRLSDGASYARLTSVTDITGADSVPVCAAALVTLA